MEQRDILKDQIEQLGKVLGQILANFLKLKSNVATSEALQICHEQMKKELGIDVDDLVVLNPDELAIYLNESNLHHSHLETLANYVFETGMTKAKTEKTTYLLQAINLLRMADERSNTVSLVRMNKIIEIQHELN